VEQCGQASKGVWGMSWHQKAKGRGRLRKVRGSCQTSFDPGIPELTQGTETSQYLEEEKENSIPSVAASERGTAQTRGVTLWGCRTTFRILSSKQKGLERPATEGESPVCEWSEDRVVS
jgi:hypothetical protein